MKNIPGLKTRELDLSDRILLDSWQDRFLVVQKVSGLVFDVSARFALERVRLGLGIVLGADIGVGAGEFNSRASCFLNSILNF